MANNLEELRERYSSLSDEDLKRIVTVDFSDYQEEALNIAKSELQKRGITDISRTSNINQDVKKTERKSKIKKVLIRTALYILWIFGWLFINMIYVENKSSIRDFEIYVLKDIIKIEDIKTVALIVGYTIGPLQFVIFALLFIGFYVITKKTKHI
ncbi:MAG: hypothetical protein AB1610_08320 [Nitrospirota bacterium]